MEILSAIIICIIIAFAYFMGGRWGYLMVWDIPKSGKPYQIISVGLLRSCSSDSPNKFYLVVYNKEEEQPRLVEVLNKKYNPEYHSRYRVGAWIYKTSAGEYNVMGK